MRLIFCPRCAESDDESTFFYNGYWSESNITDNHCPLGHEGIEIKDFEYSDAELLWKISHKPKFLEAMINLYNDDYFGFNSKMDEYRKQLETKINNYSSQIRPTQHDKNTLICPKCGSTAITTTARGVNHFWGAIGASSTVNRCGNCGNTWKPR